MKKTTIGYWTATIIIVLFEGLMPALTSNTKLAVDGIRHLGYPDYFRVLLTVFKVAGAIVLIIPAFTGRIKEWAYAGFGFVFISAMVSHLSVDRFNFQAIFPLILFGIMSISYYCYHKMKSPLFQSSKLYKNEKIKVANAVVN